MSASLWCQQTAVAAVDTAGEFGTEEFLSLLMLITTFMLAKDSLLMMAGKSKSLSELERLSASKIGVPGIHCSQS